MDQFKKPNHRRKIGCGVFIVLIGIWPGTCAFHAWRCDRLVDQIRDECNVYAQFPAKVWTNYDFLIVPIEPTMSRAAFARLLAILEDQRLVHQIWIRYQRDDWGDEVLVAIRQQFDGFDDVGISIFGSTRPFSSDAIRAFVNDIRFTIYFDGQSLRE